MLPSFTKRSRTTLCNRGYNTFRATKSSPELLRSPTSSLGRFFSRIFFSIKQWHKTAKEDRLWDKGTYPSFQLNHDMTSDIEMSMLGSKKNQHLNFSISTEGRTIHKERQSSLVGIYQIFCNQKMNSNSNYSVNSIISRMDVVTSLKFFLFCIVFSKQLSLLFKKVTRFMRLIIELTL